MLPEGSTPVTKDLLIDTKKHTSKSRETIPLSGGVAASSLYRDNNDDILITFQTSTDLDERQRRTLLTYKMKKTNLICLRPEFRGNWCLIVQSCHHLLHNY
jgi:hypothetical protein